MAGVRLAYFGPFLASLSSLEIVCRCEVSCWLVQRWQELGVLECCVKCAAYPLVLHVEAAAATGGGGTVVVPSPNQLVT